MDMFRNCAIEYINPKTKRKHAVQNEILKDKALNYDYGHVRLLLLSLHDVGGSVLVCYVGFP